MKSISQVVAVLLLLLVANACSKSPGDCFTSAGKAVTVERSIDDFTGILMFDNVDVELIKGDSPKVEVTAGEHVIENLITEVVDSVLYIKNQNGCNFVRSYNKPLLVKVFFQRIDSLEYRSVGNLICRDTISNAVRFKIDIYEGSGRIELELNTKSSHLNFYYGTADLIVSGFSDVNYIYQASYGPVDARNLITNFNYLNNSSTNDTWVHANVVMGVIINRIGNVYYWGNPSIGLERNGSGQLLRGR